MIDIVCFMGGTCGDIVTALLDPTDAIIDGNRITMPLHRQLLKKPHLYYTSQTKDQYVDFISRSYASIPSHDTEYHIQHQHPFTSITVENPTIALWAAERFKQLHKPHVWNEMISHINCKNATDYAKWLMNYRWVVNTTAARIIKLESIVSGQLGNEIELDTDKTMFYNSWLNVQEI
jgi:hypothetical protein